MTAQEKAQIAAMRHTGLSYKEIAEKYGIKTCGGMAMLVWQAAVAHEIWNGASYKYDDIAALIADMHRLMEGK